MMPAVYSMLLLTAGRITWVLAVLSGGAGANVSIASGARALYVVLHRATLGSQERVARELGMVIATVICLNSTNAVLCT